MVGVAQNFGNKALHVQAPRLTVPVLAAGPAPAYVAKKLFTLLDLCVSSLRRGHANLLCIVPSLTDDPRRESEIECRRKDVRGKVSGKVLLGKE